MYENYVEPAHTLATQCCALNMLRATNLDTFEDLKKLVDETKSYHENQMIKSFIGVKKGIGARALFCIVSPGEKVLEKNLKLLGFKMEFDFGRRRGYDPGQNKFYLLKW